MISRSAENDYVQNEKPITWKSTCIQEAANVKCNQQPYKEEDKDRAIYMKLKKNKSKRTSKEKTKKRIDYQR